MNVLEKLIESKNKDLGTLMNIIKNTIDAKFYFRKGGMDLVKKEVGTLCCNPNYAITVGNLQKACNGNKIKIGIDIESFMKELAKKIIIKL